MNVLNKHFDDWNFVEIVCKSLPIKAIKQNLLNIVFASDNFRQLFLYSLVKYNLFCLHSSLISKICKLNEFIDRNQWKSKPWIINRVKIAPCYNEF